MSSRGTLGTASGAALYIGSLIGPGVLLVPALAARAAGPASVISWGALLLLSAPLAIIFAVLGTRMPGSGGVASYVEAGFGRAAGLVTGGWFLSAVLIGAPAVSMIGGFYVADLTGSGTGVAAGGGAGHLRHRPRHERARSPGLGKAPAAGGHCPHGAYRARGGHRAAKRESLELVSVRTSRLVGDRNGGKHPHLALRRLGVRRPTHR